jgi:hypothetical protein
MACGVRLRLDLMTRGGLLFDAKLGLWNAAEVLVENRTIQIFA